MSDKVEIPDEARAAYRKLWAGLMAVKPFLDKPYPDDARWTPWTRFVEPRLEALSRALPASGGPERDYEPGTRFVVVEILPAASDKEADEITEKVFEAAHDIDAQYTGPWDLFIYRQHNAPPANVPAAGGPAVDRQVIEQVLELHKIGAFCGTDTACACDRTWRQNPDHRSHVADALVAALTEQPKEDEK